MAEHNSSSNPTGGLLFIAVAIVVAAWLLGDALVDFKRAGDTISVTGSAKRAIVSDLIIWRGEVYSQRPTKQEAYAEVKQFTERFEGFLLDNGVTADEYSFGSLNTSEIEEVDEHYRPTGVIRAYRMNRGFRVESKRVDEIADLALFAGDLVSEEGVGSVSTSGAAPGQKSAVKGLKPPARRGMPGGEGISINSWQPEYLYTKLADLRVEMLAEATKDAAERAKAMVEATGAKLGSLRSAQMGVFQITQPHSTEVSGYGMYDTTTKDKDITAVAKVSFAVE